MPIYFEINLLKYSKNNYTKIFQKINSQKNFSKKSFAKISLKPFQKKFNFIPHPARKERNRFGKIFTEKGREDVLPERKKDIFKLFEKLSKKITEIYDVELAKEITEIYEDLTLR